MPSMPSLSLKPTRKAVIANYADSLGPRIQTGSPRHPIARLPFVSQALTALRISARKLLGIRLAEVWEANGRHIWPSIHRRASARLMDENMSLFDQQRLAMELKSPVTLADVSDLNRANLATAETTGTEKRPPANARPKTGKYDKING